MYDCFNLTLWKLKYQLHITVLTVWTTEDTGYINNPGINLMPLNLMALIVKPHRLEWKWKFQSIFRTILHIYFQGHFTHIESLSYNNHYRYAADSRVSIHKFALSYRNTFCWLLSTLVFSHKNNSLVYLSCTQLQHRDFGLTKIFFEFFWTT